jgi:hypothetical protein
MATIEQEVSFTVLQHLTSEISQISEQQTQALWAAAFVGMSEDEERKYQHRRTRLAELVHELAALTSQNCTEGEPKKDGRPEFAQ